MSGILVGVDGSGHSQRALEWAMKEAAIRHLPLTVLTVHEAIRGYSRSAAVYPDDPVRTEDARAARAQDQHVGVLAGEYADMLVLGSRGAGGFTRLMMGSVAGQVAHHAYCPVLLVPPENRS